MAIYSRAFHSIGSELDVMQEYVLTVSGALKQAHEKLHADVTKKIAGMDEQEAQEFINDHAEDDIFLGDLFPALSSSWTFVSILSFLEHRLVFICREVKGAKTGDKTFQPKRDVLDSCKNCLKNLGLEVPVDGPEWQEIKKFQDIRNVIVHRLGEVDEKKAAGCRDGELYKYVRNRTDITIDYLKIVPTHKFCLHAIDAIRNFLDRIVALVPKELYDPPDRRR